MGCSPWGRKESDTTERLPFHSSFLCIGEGNGNPLQCSCLKNPREGGAWWAAIYGVAQSRTRLKRLSSSSVIQSHNILATEAPRAFYPCWFGDTGQEPTIAQTELYLLLLVLGPYVLCEQTLGPTAFIVLDISAMLGAHRHLCWTTVSPCCHFRSRMQGKWHLLFLHSLFFSYCYYQQSIIETLEAKVHLRNSAGRLYRGAYVG